MHLELPEGYTIETAHYCERNKGAAVFAGCFYQNGGPCYLAVNRGSQT
jgi:hypothetical protein